MAAANWKDANLLWGVLAVVIFCWVCTRCSAQTVTGEDDRVETSVPYIIVANTRSIFRMSLAGANVRRLVREKRNGIQALDFHYSLDYMFWSNSGDRSIKRARLNGTEITTVAQGGRIRLPAGLAVDWVNNKVYWTDRVMKIIEELDMDTLERRIVLSTGTDSLPLGLAIYPYLEQGWLFWADGSKRTIERATTQGDVKEVLYSGDSPSCPWAVTVDFATHRLYWTDYCRLSIESVGMTGSGYAMIVDPQTHQVRFSYGVSYFGNDLYWTQDIKVFTIQKSPEQKVLNIHINTGSNQRYRTLQVVHPTRQPSASDLAGFAVCEPPCLHGQCLPPGLCACRQGWTGADCSQDVNECATENGGCYHYCRNTLGSYRCSCERGFTLGDNGKSCIAPTERTPSDPPTPEDPPTDPDPIVVLPSLPPLPPFLPPTSPSESSSAAESTSSSSSPHNPTTTAVATSTPATRLVVDATTVPYVQPTKTSNDLPLASTTAYREKARSSLLTAQSSRSAIPTSLPLVTPSTSLESSALHTPVESSTSKTSHWNKLTSVEHMSSTSEAAHFSRNVVDEGVLPSPIAPPVTESKTDDTIEILIGVCLGAGVLILIAVALGYATLLHYKYNSRKGSWTPRRSPLASSDTSFRPRGTLERQDRKRSDSISSISTTNSQSHIATLGSANAGSMRRVRAEINDPFDCSASVDYETQSFRIAFLES